MPTERTQAPQPFVVTINTSVSGGAFPVIHGTTNLPDDTKLWVSLIPPYPACFPHCGDRVATPAGAEIAGYGGLMIVKNGGFTAGTAWQTYWPDPHSPAQLNLGTYILEVQFVTVSGGVESVNQPANVQAIIGTKGEYMRGPLVGACCFGYGLPGRHNTQADAQKSLKSLRSLAALGGPGVYYARYVVVPPPTSTTARMPMQPLPLNQNAEASPPSPTRPSGVPTAKAHSWYAISLNGNSCLTMQGLGQEIIQYGGAPVFSPQQLLDGLRVAGVAPTVTIHKMAGDDVEVSVSWRSQRGDEMGRIFFSSSSDCLAAVAGAIDTGVVPAPGQLQ